MKNILLTIALAAITINTYASNEPIAPLESIFTIEAIDFKMASKDMAIHSIDIVYTEKNGNLEMTTGKEVSFLQVFTETGELEYQLPVFSKTIVIDLDDFNSGKYQLNILLENENVIPATFSKR